MKRRLLVWVMAFVLIDVILIQQLFAEDPPAASPGALPNSLFTVQAPAAFNPDQGAFMSGAFGACAPSVMNPVKDAGMNILSQVGANPEKSWQEHLKSVAACSATQGLPMETPCPGSDQVGSLNPKMECSEYDEGINAANIAKLELAVCSSQCKQNKINQVRNETRCILEQVQKMKQAANSLKQQFLENVQQMQRDVVTIKANQADVEKQTKDADEILEGGVGGKPGLLKLKEDAEAAIVKMPEEIRELNSQSKEYQQNELGLQQQIAQRKISLRQECFNTSVQDNFRCSPNGKPVAAREYLLCRLQQDKGQGKGGMAERDNTTTQQAQASASGLESILDKITSGVGSQTVMTPEDIQAQYGNDLSKYQLKNSNANDFVIKMMRRCTQIANLQVNREEKQVQSDIGQAKQALVQKQLQVQSKIEAFRLQYTTEYGKATAGLTGTSIPLKFSADCQKGELGVQVGCLGKIQAEYQHVLYGDAGQPPIPIEIKGTNPLTTIKISCNSLNSCVDIVRVKRRDLGVQAENLKVFEEQYKKKAYQSAELGAAKIASQLNGPSLILQQRLQKLNAALGALGGRGINFSSVEHQKLEAEDGLPVVPDDMASFIGSRANPPMPDTSELNTAEDTVRLAERGEEKSAKLESALEQLKMLPMKCMKEKNQKIAEKLQNSLSAVSGSCALSSHCENQALTPKSLHNALEALEILQEAPLRTETDMERLETGVDDLCKDSVVSPGSSYLDEQERMDQAKYLKEKRAVEDKYQKDKTIEDEKIAEEEDALRALKLKMNNNPPTATQKEVDELEAKHKRDQKKRKDALDTTYRDGLKAVEDDREERQNNLKIAKLKKDNDSSMQSKKACDQFMQGLVNAKSQLAVPESVRSRLGKGKGKKAN